uniref:Uncharacterized protein n=1 Tax=Octopus bimaculoides TaxID=37653 RepID=A0A0L8G8D3_OCTBM
MLNSNPSIGRKKKKYPAGCRAIGERIVYIKLCNTFKTENGFSVLGGRLKIKVI